MRGSEAGAWLFFGSGHCLAGRKGSAMDRRVSETYQDGSSKEFVYDLASDVVTYTDENGSVFSNTWDHGACLGS